MSAIVILWSLLGAAPASGATGHAHRFRVFVQPLNAVMGQAIAMASDGRPGTFVQIPLGVEFGGPALSWVAELSPTYTSIDAWDGGDNHHISKSMMVVASFGPKWRVKGPHGLAWFAGGKVLGVTGPISVAFRDEFGLHPPDEGWAAQLSVGGDLGLEWQDGPLFAAFVMGAAVGISNVPLAASPGIANPLWADGVPDGRVVPVLDLNLNLLRIGFGF